MVKESLSKIKDGKTPGPSGLVQGMVKLADEARVDMITDLINQILSQCYFYQEKKRRFR